MSDRLTGISLPGHFGSGLADWGLKTPDEMIKMIREKAARDKAVAEAILSAADEDFHIDTYLGPYAMRNRKVLQQGRNLVCPVCGGNHSRLFHHVAGPVEEEEK